MERIILKQVRADINRKYVGFNPDGASVKPVHISSGAHRVLYGSVNRTNSIKKMALVCDTKGCTPKGSDTESIYKELLRDNKIESSVETGSLDSMRKEMQRLLSADKGVYVVKNLSDNMISYSAGSKYFLTSKSIYEDAGELIGVIINSYCPDLAAYIKELLDKSNDPITRLFKPVLDENFEIYTGQVQCEDIPAFHSGNDRIKGFVNGIRKSGDCLLEHLSNHPNALTQLRLFNLFCIFELIRYMSMLEAFYCEGSVRPLVLDFSGKSPSTSRSARVSEASFMQVKKSINRFYSYEYSEWLRERGYTKEDLQNSETPVYEEKSKSGSKKGIEDQLDELWEFAKERSKYSSDEEAFSEFGDTMNDMLALEASSHPDTYLRALGTSSGILYPPDKFHPDKRFVVSQDVLEMLIRCCVKPEETIIGEDIRERLWDRFGIIIGGSQYEMSILQSSGAILQSDEDTMEDNFSNFAALLESMDFAEVMADGVLQIRIGGFEKV